MFFLHKLNLFVHHSVIKGQWFLLDDDKELGLLGLLYVKSCAVD